MTVPLLDLKLQNQNVAAELEEAFRRVLHSGQFILGPEVENFESSLAARIGVSHAIGVSSGTDAILLALMALGIGPGDEVICPSYTFFSTAGCVARVGATPVFADSLLSDFNIDPESAAGLISSRTKAIIPVHLFGQTANLTDILDLANTHGLAVIEDAAQALGAADRGRQAGTVGSFGTYSFFPSKNLGGFGDGGLLVTNDSSLADRARILRAHGAQPKYYHRFIGANFRPDALQCALLSVKLPFLEDYSANRSTNARYYSSAFADLDPQNLILPSEAPGKRHIWNQYTLRVLNGKRDRLRAFLTARGIGTEIYYPLPLHRQECFTKAKEQPPELPVSDQLAAEALSIPVFPELTRPQADAVVDAVRAFFA